METTRRLETAKYVLIDGKTGQVIKVYTYDKRNYARRRLDRMDNAYGAYRYQIKLVFADETDYNKY